jgi:predicted metal-dependent phosphoesterase TrpH
VVLPHPCDTFRRDTPRIRALDKGLLKAKIDAVEVFNSRCILGRSNDRADRLAEELGKHRLGGSDAHNISEVGRARTRFSCDSPEEVHSQLKMNTPINTVVQGRLSSRLVHFSSILNRLQK